MVNLLFSSCGFFWVLLHIVSFSPAVLGYKKDYGFGFMFKYDPNFRERREAEGSLNGHIKDVINHYKQEDPVGLPSEFDGLVLDPLPVANFQRTFSGVKMLFRDTQIYGLSRFRLEELNSDLAEMKVNMKISMESLLVLGRYMMSAWISKSQGNFNVSIVNVVLKADAELMIDDQGFLKVRQMTMDLTFEDLKMHFEKLGFLGKMFQGIVNKVGVFIFETIKPTIWNEVEVKLRDILNKESRNIPHQFPNSINPVDQTLATARTLIMERGLDPVALADYSTQSSKWSKFELYHGYLHGLSSIRRTGPILLGFERNTIYLAMHLGVENLQGSYQWSWTALRGVFGRSGQLNFSLDFVSIEIRLQQSVNLEKKPIVDSINLTLGPASLTSDGIGAIDYLLEMIFNVAPNVFRQRVAEAAEYPLTKAIEDELQKLNIEELIEENA